MIKKIWIFGSLLLAICIAVFFIYLKNFSKADVVSWQSGDYVAGCENSVTAKCIDFGSNSPETASGSVFSNVNGSNGTFADWFDGPSIEGATRYHYMKNGFQLSIPAVGPRDEDLFPKVKLMLEVRYKDDYTNNESSSSNMNRIFISSKVDTKLGSEENYKFMEVGSLLGTNDDKWKYEQIFYDLNDYQRISATNNKYVFKFEDKRILKTPIPIDYISLKVVEDEEVSHYKDTFAARMGVTRVEYKENKKFNFSNYDMAWFSASPMKPIYKNYIPEESEFHRKIDLTSAIGETEPFSFGIYSYVAPTADISFNIKDLTLTGDTSKKISAGDISIKKVVYNDKLWAHKKGKLLTEDPPTYESGTYGSMPDYVEDFDKVTIDDETSQQFWGEIKIGEGAAGGVYSGEIEIMQMGRVASKIPVSIEVVPIKLSNPGFVSVMYHDPSVYLTNKGMPLYSLFGSTNAVKDDMKSHDVNNVLSLLDISIGDNCGTIDTKNFENNFMTLKNEGLLSDTAAYIISPLYSRAIGACVPSTSTANAWVKRRDPNVHNKLVEVFKRVKEFGEKNGTEIILIGEDEPSGKYDRTTSAIITARAAHEAGLRVWSTYSYKAALPVECPDDYCMPCEDFCYEQNGKKYLPALTDYIDLKAWYLNAIKREEKDFHSSFGYYTTDYSQIRNPVVMRFLNGYYPENAEGEGAKIVANWAYIGEPGSDPYNEFDQNPKYKSTVYDPDYFMSYPAWDRKPRATFSLKGYREGIKDAKYIQTLKELISANPGKADAINAQSFLDMITADSQVNKYFAHNYRDKATSMGIHFYMIKWLSDYNNGSDYAVFDRYRKQMIDYIKILNRPHITIKANKTKVSVGDEIVYTVDFKNTLVRKVDDNIISVNIPSGTTYKEGSATDGGVYKNNKIEWKLNELSGNQSKKYMFKVRVN